MTEILDEILLSDNVVESFHKFYENNKFKQWLLNILPEVENCKNTKQDNPWHVYNCLDHILTSVEHMNMQTLNMAKKDRRMLAYTMFLHDIGKPECYFRRYSKLYQREVDSYFNHNKASKKIADRVLPKLGFSDNEIEKMGLLIHEHDVFMNLTIDEDNKHKKKLTNEVIKSMVEKYNDNGDGVHLLNQLIMVGKSDNLAQNPEMTGKSLLLLDTMQEMVNKLYPEKNL